MTTNATGKLTQRQLIVAVALMAQPQYAEIRRNLNSQINRIVGDNAVSDEISAKSGATVPELRAAATYFGTVNTENKFDQQEFSRHTRGLTALFEAPQVRETWETFTVKTQQLSTDSNVVNAIERYSGVRRDEVQADLPQIIEYRPAMAGTTDRAESTGQRK